MILTTLPDLPPRPETAANAAFRRRFYARWGRENAIVCGRATLAEYAELPQTLSLKMVRGGRECYFVGRRELVVDDDNWLVLNDGARYASVLRAPRPASTFSVFFRPGLAAEVAAQRRRSLGAMLDAPECVATPPAFSEHLRGHGGAVTARLRHLEQAVHAGERDANWLEAQCMALLDALLVEDHGTEAAAPSPRAAQRAELLRRLRQAADCIEGHFDQPLTVEHLAAVACLSRYHFVREFGRAFGLAPHAYLNRKRARAAARMLASHADREWVAQQCGFGSRWSLQRALARHLPAAA